MGLVPRKVLLTWIVLGLISVSARSFPSAPFPVQPLAAGQDFAADAAWQTAPLLKLGLPAAPDFSGQVQFEYDASALFVRVRVMAGSVGLAPESGVSAGSSNLYAYDSFEFWIGRHQFTLALAGGRAVGFDYLRARTLTEGDFRGTVTADGYQIMARLPWSELEMKSLPRETLQLLVQFNHVARSGGKSRHLQVMAPTAAEWDLPASYGTVFLNDTIPVNHCAAGLAPLVDERMELGAFRPRNRLLLGADLLYGPVPIRYEAVDGTGTVRCSGRATSQVFPACVDLPLAAQAGVNQLRLYAELPQGEFGPIMQDFFAEDAEPLTKYRSNGAPPADFNAFWDRAHDDLEREPMDAQVQRINRPGALADLFQVTLGGYRSVRFVAFLSVPKAAGIFPLDVNGYPARATDQRDVEPQGDRAVLRISPPGFGPSAAYSTGPSEPYVTACARPEDFYFLANVLAFVRAIDYALTNPKVDPHRIFVAGGSRGGFLTMALMAADPRITAGHAVVPCYADLDMMGRVGHASAASDAYLALEGGSPERRADMYRVWPYFDTVNLATRIHSPVVVEAGMIDTICAAPGIADAFNHIPATEKYLLLNPERGHEGTPAGDAIFQLLQQRCASRSAK